MDDDNTTLPSSNSIEKVHQMTDRAMDFENDLRGDRKFVSDFSPPLSKNEEVKYQDHQQRILVPPHVALGTRADSLELEDEDR